MAVHVTPYDLSNTKFNDLSFEYFSSIWLHHCDIDKGYGYVLEKDIYINCSRSGDQIQYQKMRSTVVHWLVEISHEFCVDKNTLFKSVKLIDVYVIDLRNNMGKPLMGSYCLNNKIVTVPTSRLQCVAR